MSADAPTDPALRTLTRVGLGGLGITAILTVIIAIAAGTESGRTPLVMAFLGMALSAATVALVGCVTLLRDQVRDEPISRARIVVVIAGFFGTTLLMAMAIGVAAGASAT